MVFPLLTRARCVSFIEHDQTSPFSTGQSSGLSSLLTSFSVVNLFSSVGLSQRAAPPPEYPHAKCLEFDEMHLTRPKADSSLKSDFCS